MDGWQSIQTSLRQISKHTTNDSHKERIAISNMMEQSNINYPEVNFTKNCVKICTKRSSDISGFQQQLDPHHHKKLIGRRKNGQKKRSKKNIKMVRMQEMEQILKQLAKKQSRNNNHEDGQTTKVVLSDSFCNSPLINFDQMQVKYWENL